MGRHSLKRSFVAKVEYDLMGRMVDHTPEYIEVGREAQVEAVSYRGVLVSAVVVAADRLGEIVLITGANIKPNTSKTTVCAETVAYAKLQKENDRRFEDSGRSVPNFLVPLGIVVVSNTDKQTNEGITGVATPVLHMCANCRVRGADDPRITADLPVVSAHADHDIYQAHTQAGLNSMYDEHDFPAVPIVRDLSRWSKRVARYDELVNAELRWDEQARRLPGELAVNALMADLSNVYG